MSLTPCLAKLVLTRRVGAAPVQVDVLVIDVLVRIGITRSLPILQFHPRPKDYRVSRKLALVESGNRAGCRVLRIVTRRTGVSRQINSCRKYRSHMRFPDDDNED